MIHIDISPVAFNIGAVEVRWYGIMTALAILAVLIWTVRSVRKTDISTDTIFTLALVGIPSGVIGARLMHVIDYWDHYMQYPAQIIGIGTGLQGLAIWGAVLGTAAGIAIYAKIKHLPIGRLFDYIAPGILLGQMLGRVGCVLNGCCYGDHTDAWFSIVYTNPLSSVDHDDLNVPVHPTQIYEIIFLGIMFVTLLWLRKRLTGNGVIFMVYLSLYSVWRIGIGVLREGTPFVFGLQEAQVIGVITLAITIPLLFKNARWGKPADKSGNSDSTPTTTTPTEEK